MELNAESNRLVEGLQLRLEVLGNFSWTLNGLDWNECIRMTSLSPAYSAPVSENWDCKKPKPRR